MSDQPLLAIRGLSTYFGTDDGTVKAVHQLDLDLPRGKTLGIVGESGSGKSVTSLSIMRLIPEPPGRIVSGRVAFDGADLLALKPEAMRKVRGKRIAMIFQDPMTSLNPFMRVSRQLTEVTRLHLGYGKEEAFEHAVRMLELVGISDARARVRSYPHEFSGGMRQRVMIAMALSCQPELLIADEPTTALDVTTQAQILDLIRRLQRETGTSVILITHDLGVVAGMADDVVVMYAGMVFERAPVKELFARSGNPYTRALLRAVPGPTSAGRALFQIPGSPPDLARLGPGCPFAPAVRPCSGCVPHDRTRPRRAEPCTCVTLPLCYELVRRASSVMDSPAVSPEGATPLVTARDLSVHFDLGGRGVLESVTDSQRSRSIVKAVDRVSLEIQRGETLGLVGESGCGKSTLGRALLRLDRVTGGEVWFDGVNLTRLSEAALRPHRQRMQIIFQDPYASLNPRMTAGQIVSEPMENFDLARGQEKDDRVRALFETVGLSPRFINRYPHEFSGGQQQRIGIARALAVEPTFIVADEPISALDVSIQAQIINLIEKIQQERRLTYLFISHDLRAIRHTADRVAVMYLGKLVELASTEALYGAPLMPYAKALVAAVPIPDPVAERARKRIVLEGDLPSPLNPPSGCRFHTRCPHAIPECSREEPPLVEIQPGHFAACLRISAVDPDIEQVSPGTASGLG